MDGVEALIEINKTKALQAIYITGNSDQETRSRAKKTNLLAFCEKLFSFEELDRIIGHWGVMITCVNL